MHFTHPVVDPFQQLACRRYPSNTRAILALKRLGLPPTSPDLENPSPDVRTALQILAAFTCTITADSMGSNFGNLRPHTPTETAILVGKNWASSVGPWVQMFMDKYIPEHKDFTAPSGLEGRDFLDIILHVLPSLLIYPMKHPDERATIRELRSISPQFTKLATQAMLTTIETNHFSWTSWSYTLTNILFFHADDRAEIPAILFRLQASSPTRAIPEIYVRLINRECVHSREEGMIYPQIQGIRLSMIFFESCTKPQWAGTHQQGISKALTNLLRTLIVHRKPLRNVQDDENSFSFAHEIIDRALKQLQHNAVMGPYHFIEVIDGGLVNTMLRAHQFFRDRQGRLDVARAFVALLKLMSMFFVYPSVLHHFLRAVKSAIRAGVDWDEPGPQLKAQDVSRVPSPLREAWKEIKRFSNDLHSIWCKLKTEHVMCAYEQCSLFLSRLRNREIKIQNHRYLRCSACRTAMYCSRDCAKNAWKAHRNVCAGTVRDSRAGFGLPSNGDTAFVQALAQKYIVRNGRAVYAALNKHLGRDGNISDLDSDNLSESVYKAIVVLDFCRPDFMSAASLSVADVETIATDDRIERLGGLGDYIRQCYRENVAGNLIVATFCPSVGRGPGIPWCHVFTILEPDYASDSDGDGGDSADEGEESDESND